MPRKPIKVKIKKNYPDYLIEFFKTGKMKSLELMLDDKLPSEERHKRQWHEGKTELLSEWIKEFPCSRPWMWWERDTPRQPRKNNGLFWDGTLPMPREKVSGSGTMSKEGYVSRYTKGVFHYWEFNEDDPPYFESEAVYLKRHGLLTEKEEEHLSKYPELLKPQRIDEILPNEFE